MRIGLDTTPLPQKPVGAGNYILNLVRALAQIETQNQYVIIAQRSGQELIDIPQRPGVEWVIVPDRSPARRLIWEQTHLPRLVERAGIELLHSLHYTKPARLGCASVVTFHDMTFFLYPHLHTRSKRLFFPWAMRLSARQADALAAVSENTRLDAIRLLGIPEQKIYTTPLGIGEEFHPISDPALLEACRQRYQLPEKFILYVGLIEPRKNLPLLVSAYVRLARQADLPPLVLAGRLGWMYNDLLAQIEETGMKERILLPGYIPAQDLPIIYNLAQLFVYPSIYEGFGLPPLEAMACGTPVITSRVSSMLSQVGEAGILIPPQDEEALAEAILRVLKDQTLQQELSRKGCQQAAQFTWEITARRTLEVYQHVAAVHGFS